MLVFSHLVMSQLIRNAVSQNGYQLNEKSFRYGNVRPDLVSLVWHHSHRISDSFDFVLNQMSALLTTTLEDDPKIYSRRLGVVCHYITDFFTFAHNDRYDGNLSEHMRYEKEIHHCIPAFHKALDKSTLLYVHEPDSIESLINYILNMHEIYMQAETGVPVRDLSFAFYVCTVTCKTLLALSESSINVRPAAAI